MISEARNRSGWSVTWSSGKYGAPSDRPADRKEHTSELQSRQYLVCRLLLEKKKENISHPVPAAIRRPVSRTDEAKVHPVVQPPSPDAYRFTRSSCAPHLQDGRTPVLATTH